MTKIFLFFFSAVLLFLSCGGDSSDDQGGVPTSNVPVYTPTVSKTYSHDTSAWTEGLFYSYDILYESTGLLNKSSLRKVDLASGQVTQQIDLASIYYGEGATLMGDKIVQLTYTSGKGFVYDSNTFTLLDEFTYSTEGWGVTYDGEYLIMSDGTDILYYFYLDSNNDFIKVKEVKVTADGEAVTKLNELEYINGYIYANVWETDRIAIIQTDGEVIGWIDLEEIASSLDCPGDIDALNGIAYNAEEDLLYVTGKYWCKLFALQMVI